MAERTRMDYWFLPTTENYARSPLPFMPTTVGSSLGSGAGQDLTTAEFIGPVPYRVMSAEAESAPSRAVQASAFLYRALSWLPAIRIPQWLAGTGQDQAALANPETESGSKVPAVFSAANVGKKLSSAMQTFTDLPGKVFGSVQTTIFKVLILTVIVAIASIWLLTMIQARAARGA